jgi:hypothetical protein
MTGIGMRRGDNRKCGVAAVGVLEEEMKEQDHGTATVMFNIEGYSPLTWPLHKGKMTTFVVKSGNYQLQVSCISQPRSTF